MKTIIIFFLLCGICYAGEVEIGRDKDGKPIKITYSDKYSFKDYTSANLSLEKLDNVTIYASCFSKETPDSHVFPDNVKNLTLAFCNLDNTFIPQGAKVIGGANRRFKVQNDRNDWEIDKDNKPIKPLDTEQYTKLGVSIDPKDLPTTMMTENILEVKQKELNAKNTIPITP